MAEIVLVRHGQTTWSAAGKHTSYTDIDLTPDGERQARGLGAHLAGRAFAAVIGSPRKRALRTAQIAGLAVTDVDDDLAEWDYGDYEGITTGQIRERRPDWDLWTQGCPNGESAEQVAARLDRVLRKAALLLRDGDVVLVGHGHGLRVAAARWVELPAAAGRILRLDTATSSALGYEHARPVIVRWNTAVTAAPRAVAPDPAPRH